MARQQRVAILGATGAVGTELLTLLEERHFPVADLKLLASPRSAGTYLTFKGSGSRLSRFQKRPSGAWIWCWPLPEPVSPKPGPEPSSRRGRC
jgi:hypothetical protein